MQIAILGPLEVRDDTGRPVEIAGARLRSLVARLAVDAGRWVSTDALVDAVWDGRPPADEANALQTLVSRVRRALGDAGAVASSAAGYRLAPGSAESIDAARFETAIRAAGDAARAGRDGEAAALLDDALALWRGPALSGIAGAALSAEADRLEQSRNAARVQRAELRGGPGADLRELEDLVAEQPLNEHLAVLRLRALAAAGRQADALAAYERLRATLADELGVDPSAEAREAHLEVLRGETPAPAAPVNRRSNLRWALTSFVGRDAELAAIRDLLAEQRLVTLVGPGGAGKTRLATEAARGLSDQASDGVWLAELAAVTEGADVAQAVLSSIGLRELHGVDPTTAVDATTRLVTGLAERSLVVVLDNCEHVVDDAARLAETLLGQCSGLRVLATSREPLGIAGESLYPVPPLPRPAEGSDSQVAAGFAAVALFADRAAAARPGFVLDATSVGPVVDIVRRLDGLPLAIELAAARLRSLPLTDLAAGLSDRFRLLTGGSRTALPRHRTLRAVVEWSWDLLEAGERELIETLAVFPAGVTIASAEAVRPDGIDAGEVADLLFTLVDKSLLQPVGEGRRFRLLETIREFGIERLAERGELERARAKHAGYFVGLLGEAAPYLTRSEQLPWMAIVRAEQENMLAALRYLAAAGEIDRALRAAIDMSLFSILVGNQHESSLWLGEVLAVPGGDADLRVVAEATKMVTTDFRGDGMHERSEQALAELATRLGNVDSSVSPMLAMLRPGVAFLSGDLSLARRLLADAATNADPWIRACSLLMGTNLHENEGEVDEMRADAAVALEAFREIGERWGIANSLRMIGQIRTLDGDLAGAAAAYDESMRLRQELTSEDDTIFLLNELADLAFRQGDEVAARAYLDRAVEQAERAPSDFESYFAWLTVAEMERRTGSRERARHLAADAHARLSEVPTSAPVQRYVHAMLFRLLGALAVDDGDVATAGEYGATAYEAARATKDLPVLASLGVFSADLSRARGDATRAAMQLGAAARLRGSEDATALDIRTLADRLRGELGEAEYAAHYAKGTALGRDEAVEALDPALPD